MVTRGHDVGLDDHIEARRAARRVRRHFIAFFGSVHVLHRANGDDHRIVARALDGSVLRAETFVVAGVGRVIVAGAARVACRADDDDARFPRRLNRHVQGVGGVAFVHGMAEGYVENADFVRGLVLNDPVDARDDVADGS